VPSKLLCLLAALLLAACASSPDGPRVSQRSAAAIAYGDPSAFHDPRYAAIVVDAESGEVLHAQNADALRHPASLAKMMTLYILFGEMEAGRFSLDDPLPVSAHAARQPASKLGLKAGQTIRVGDAIGAIAVRSANDVAVVVAEAISGSEPAFADRMTSTALSLGMSRTRFTNASGLPDPAQVTTAHDMAVLARALQTRFPGEYPVFSRRTFAYAGRTHQSTNKLLGVVDGVDGIKTGYIRASGYNLAASARRGGRRIIVIVFGGSSGAARDAQVAALVEEYLPNRSFFLAWR
jgi:D-alanyl-D-alanine carboxypeptidase